MLDKDRIRHAFDRAAGAFDANDFLHDEIRGRLIDRLVAIRVEPRRILDLGAGTGRATQLFAGCYPDTDVISLDFSAAMLGQATAPHQAVCADACAVPLADASVDMVFSNLMLHHCQDPAAVIAEARRVMTDNGVLLLTTFGRVSLIELGRAWASADRYTHIAPFFDILELGNLLTSHGFTEPVVDSQTLTVTYDSLDKLLQDLRAAGSCNATSGRNRGLTGRVAWQKLAMAYDQLRDADGKLPVTLEVLFCVTWAGQRVRAGGEIEVSVEDLIGTRRNPFGSSSNLA